jgi:hypothetical protein
VVDDLDVAVKPTVRAGGTIERQIDEPGLWRLVARADPFGPGLDLIAAEPGCALHTTAAERSAAGQRAHALPMQEPGARKGSTARMLRFCSGVWRAVSATLADTWNAAAARRLDLDRAAAQVARRCHGARAS